MKAFIFAVLLLAGCTTTPPGVDISEEEAELCKNYGCSVWTRMELEELARTLWKRGYDAGRKSL